MSAASAASAALRAALECGGRVSDAEFDVLYPPELRDRSELQWTPIEIAKRAAALLDAPRGAEILDVGSGVGKTCLVAQLSTGVRWWGVEHEAVLVDAANQAAWQLGIRDDARFVCAGAWDIDWARFDAFYFFNPFPATRSRSTARSCASAHAPRSDSPSSAAAFASSPITASAATCPTSSS
jgi:SAM-dependent methyltransferase